MRIFNLILLLLIVVMAVPLIPADNASAEEYLVCPPEVGDIRIDWRSEYKGSVTELADGTQQAVCTYVLTYDNFNNPEVYASIMAQWCAQQPCGNENSHSGHYSNDVWSDDMRALVTEAIPYPDHSKIVDASADIQKLKMDLLAQAEALAVFRDEPEPEVNEETPEDDPTPEQAEFIPEGPFNRDCSINEEEFDRDWIKYSDFDDAIIFESRSYESQQYHSTLSKATELMLEAYILDRNMEIDRNMRKELKEYRNALVRNLKQNLIKSFIRLTWLTYDTIKSAVSLGKSYGGVVANAEATGIEQMRAVGDFVRANIPADSAIAFNTKTTTGKFMAVGAKGTLDAMDAFMGGDFSAVGNLKSASSVGSGLFSEIVKQSGIVPAGPALSEQDFALLKDQNERTKALDIALAESYRINSERRARIKEIQAEVAQLKNDADGWEDKEKERVQLILEDDCRNQKERFEGEQ